MPRFLIAGSRVWQCSRRPQTLRDHFRERVGSASFDFDELLPVGLVWNSDDQFDIIHFDSMVHFLFPSLALERFFSGLAASTMTTRFLVYEGSDGRGRAG